MDIVLVFIGYFVAVLGYCWGLVELLFAEPRWCNILGGIMLLPIVVMCVYGGGPDSRPKGRRGPFLLLGLWLGLSLGDDGD